MQETTVENLVETKVLQQPVGALCRADAAKYLAVSVRSLDALRERGELVPVRIGQKPVYRVDDLNRLLQR